MHQPQKYFVYLYITFLLFQVSTVVHAEWGGLELHAFSPERHYDEIRDMPKEFHSQLWHREKLEKIIKNNNVLAFTIMANGKVAGFIVYHLSKPDLSVVQFQIAKSAPEKTKDFILEHLGQKAMARAKTIAPVAYFSVPVETDNVGLLNYFKYRKGSFETNPKDDNKLRVKVRLDPQAAGREQISWTKHTLKRTAVPVHEALPVVPLSEPTEKVPPIESRTQLAQHELSTINPYTVLEVPPNAALSLIDDHYSFLSAKAKLTEQERIILKAAHWIASQLNDIEQPGRKKLIAGDWRDGNFSKAWEQAFELLDYDYKSAVAEDRTKVVPSFKRSLDISVLKSAIDVTKSKFSLGVAGLGARLGTRLGNPYKNAIGMACVGLCALGVSGIIPYPGASSYLGSLLYDVASFPLGIVSAAYMGVTGVKLLGFDSNKNPRNIASCSQGYLKVGH